jgi:hypothetical protein
VAFSENSTVTLCLFLIKAYGRILSNETSCKMEVFCLVLSNMVATGHMQDGPLKLWIVLLHSFLGLLDQNTTDSKQCILSWFWGQKSEIKGSGWSPLEAGLSRMVLGHPCSVLAYMDLTPVSASIASHLSPVCLCSKFLPLRMIQSLDEGDRIGCHLNLATSTVAQFLNKVTFTGTRALGKHDTTHSSN